jgi:C4-dicarboxylate-specific signal transduction histidine kinase
MVAANEGVSPAKIAEILGKASAQVERAGQIVARLRGLVDKGETERTEEDIAATIDEAVSLIEPNRVGVALRRDIDADLPAAVIDKVQIQQVLINLMRNAAEAMQQVEGRELLITARAVDRELLQVADVLRRLGPAYYEASHVTLGPLGDTL